MKRKLIHIVLPGVLLAGILFSCQSVKDVSTGRTKNGIDSETIMLIKDMGVGWNAGNSLEAMGGETAWGKQFLML
jgi:hypothetical protein